MWELLIHKEYKIVCTNLTGQKNLQENREKEECHMNIGGCGCPYS